MILILFTVLTLFCKNGTLMSYNDNTRYKLKCPDKKRKECFFVFDVPAGEYMYLSYDKKDTTILIVGEKIEETHIYKTTGNFLFKQN